MTRVALEDGGFQVDARVLGQDLRLDASAVQALMREGRITGRCERGEDADAGRHRLTFFYGNRRLRLIVDAAGNILQRSTIDFGERPLPAGMRRPGG
jgi:hypothetical protein